ncbi:Gem-associated protein 2 [Entamoeba marina]
MVNYDKSCPIKTDFPSFKEFKTMILSSPDIDYLIHFPSSQINAFLPYIVQISRQQTQFSSEFIQWVYGILLLLQKPFGLDIRNDLRKILVYFCRARHAIFDIDDANLPSYHVIATIIAKYFQVVNEDDCI